MASSKISTTPPCFPDGTITSIYKVLSPDNIVLHMNETIEHFSVMLPLPPTTIRVLLNHVNWNTEKLLETYYSKSDAINLFNDAGIRVPSDKEQKSSVSSKPNNEHLNTEECQVCISTKIPSQMSEMQCGHKYCNDCWNTYVCQVIKQGTASNFKITCIAHDCFRVMTDETVMKFTRDSKMRLRYKSLIINSFVQSNPNFRWCPSPDCTRAIKITSLHVKELFVKCDCGQAFCFQCGGDAHAPVTCEMLAKWNRKRDAEENGNLEADLVSLNIKQCPKCNAYYQRTGCGTSVHCRICDLVFCWTCVEAWNTHDMSKCNGIKGEGKTISTRDFSFYLNRYKSQELSLKQELKLNEYVKDKIAGRDEIQFVQNAVDVLCQCRHVLMYSYVVAYYIESSEDASVFFANRNELKSAVDKLSRILNGVIGGNGILKLKIDVKNLCVYCLALRSVLVDFVCNIKC